MRLNIKRFDKDLPLPEYDNQAACFDLRCREAVIIQPKEVMLVPVNFALKIPTGYALLIFSRSSTPLRKGLMLANGVGVVDPFYCGDKDEVMVEFFNFTDQPVAIEKGSKLAQGMIIKTETVEWEEVENMKDEGVGGYKISGNKG